MLHEFSLHVYTKFSKFGKNGNTKLVIFPILCVCENLDWHHLHGVAGTETSFQFWWFYLGNFKDANLITNYQASKPKKDVSNNLCSAQSIANLH